jgi:drug/metabolite transporter (DMT)-like permease
MSALAFALVGLAAVLHASWNAIVKASGDRVAALGAVSAAHGACGALAAIFLPFPLAEAWPYIIASTLIHYAYYGFLFLSYRLGDLSQVYPISRGLAPVLVTLGAQVFAGEVLPPLAWGGVLAVSFGIFLLSVGGAAKNPKAALAAVGTGLIISAYSVVDGIGVRLAGDPWSYIAWLFILETPVPVAIGVMFARNGRRAPVGPGLVGGVLSAFAYALVLYAKSFAAIGAVSAVRESSVIIAALIGVVLLGERPWRLRLVSAGIVVAGVLLLAASI